MLVNNMEQKIITDESIKEAAVIVAHPDDETLWAGGTILMHPKIEWTVIALCRAGDADRMPKFINAINYFHAKGTMGNLDDGPEQKTLKLSQVKNTVLSLLPSSRFDLILTHSPYGEYTRHRRHEETGLAVLSLYKNNRLRTKNLWLFAYEDGQRSYFPRPIQAANKKIVLPVTIWKEKYRIITDVYGFPFDSFEAKTTPKEEAFWCFFTSQEVKIWLSQGGHTR